MTGRRRSLVTAIQKALREFPDEYLECRQGRRHDFSWRTARHQRIRDGGRDLRETTRTCPRCGTKRIDLYDANTLRRMRSHRYDYPEGYLALGLGMAAFEPEDVLGELLRRFPGVEADDE